MVTILAEVISLGGGVGCGARKCVAACATTAMKTNSVTVYLSFFMGQIAGKVHLVLNVLCMGMRLAKDLESALCLDEFAHEASLGIILEV